ncbi:MAG: PH domain-containing protein [Chloroflexota bacterium]
MGSYAETLLAPGEVVVHRSHQHWLSLILESVFSIILWAVALGGIVLSLVWTWNNPLAAQARLIVVAGAIILGVALLAWRWWHWRTEEYLITNRRLLKVTGIVNKRSGDSSLEKINDAILEENVIGRMLNYGDLDILTAAEIAVDKYRMLAGAKDFKKQMLQAKHALETGMVMGDLSGARPMMEQVAAPAPVAAPVAPAPVAVPGLADPIDTPEEVTAALAQLATLRDQGAISQADYEAKKQELLRRL